LYSYITLKIQKKQEASLFYLTEKNQKKATFLASRSLKVDLEAEKET